MTGRKHSVMCSGHSSIALSLRLTISRDCLHAYSTRNRNMAALNLIDRRRLLQAMAFGACGISVSGWLPALAAQLATDPQRRRHCILLWMSGGPSQIDTWDMKPGHENGGTFKEIATKVPGVRFSEHLPKLAQQADKLAIIRC